MIDHNQVRPFVQPQATTSKEKSAVKYKPQLHITDGCHPYPAVQADGSVSGGLEWSGDDDGKCKRSPWGSQVYSRADSYEGKYAIMYAWYFPKGKGHAHKHHDGHRHCWEFAIIWLSRPSANESVIVGVTTSISDDFHHEVPLEPKHVVGSSVKLDSYSTFWGAKQGLRLTSKIGEFQDLIQWEQLTDEARTALSEADFNIDGGKPAVQMPLKDDVFQQKLVDGYPF
ncbi:unnamed protein product [Phytophthora fragariaefolia]|uniref:Unnamed protein product n=1 Tax=Phytophthora fragariaefolia TaxID=1490495 RepID=A0A9W6UCH8_9STRA|nr:unnamed protein product [Phytophthora fragariaefolia]